MANPVRWNRGPWRTPAVMSQQPPMATVANPYSGLSPNDTEGNITGSLGQRQPESFGPMNAEQRNALRGLGIASTIAGGPLAGLNMPIGGLLMGDLIARLANVPTVTNPYANMMTPEALAELEAIDPNAASRQREAEAEAMSRLSSELHGFEGVAEPGPMGGLGEGGGGYGGESPGVGQGASTGGTDHGGPGGATYAKGGVASAMRGPRRITFGEAGPEKAIMVPKMMERPGMQGREMEVMHALMQTLTRLKGGRR